MKKKNNSLHIYIFYNRSLYLFCGQKWFQLVFYSHMLAQIRSFYHHQQSAMKENEFIRQFLFNNSGDLRKWILFNSSTDSIMSQINIEGEQNLLAEIKQGKGLILVNFHTGLSQATHLALKTMGLANNTYSIAKVSHDQYGDQKNGNKINGRNGTDVFATQTLQAAEVLLNGGVVFISIDGEKGGNRGVATPFLGRWHVFKTGFAELALATDVEVIPVSTSLLPDGTVELNFLAPIDKGDDQTPKAARIEGMIKQLSTFMGQQWITSPTTIKYKKLLFHNKQPLVQNPDRVPSELSLTSHEPLTVHGFPYMLLKRIRRYKKDLIRKKTH